MWAHLAESVVVVVPPASVQNQLHVSLFCQQVQ